MMSPESRRRIIAFWTFIEAGREVDCGADPALPPIFDDMIVMHYSANGASAMVHAKDMRELVAHLESLDEVPTAHASVMGGKLTPVVSDSLKWRYDKAPIGAKLFLLTHGGVAVVGNWRDDGGFIGWHPLFDRDRAAEAKALGEKREKSVADNPSAGTPVNPGPSPEHPGTATDPAVGSDSGGQASPL